ncbi:DNA mismatch repair protein MutT [Roseivivax halodurans JCM 10272]|uniref:DNA mismatch repair protein MutT n=2 Tax=Roseivivax halodurans TaxID=93683 RepID=X7EFS5_9RHOB|nr:DNA mismatch repair protein MutT [Roseivivax halodurans JCM 10272]
MSAAPDDAFAGTKVLLFLGSRILVIRRDPYPGIVWPGRLDLPGGGREGSESPEVCAVRETKEEVGLDLDPSAFLWKADRQNQIGRHWMFAAKLSAKHAKDVRLGTEGTGWTLMAPDVLLNRTDAIPPHQQMLRRFLADTGEGSPGMGTGTGGNRPVPAGSEVFGTDKDPRGTGG